MGTAGQTATQGGRRLAALVAAALAVAIAACGEEDPMANIPQEDASAMVDRLDQARADVAAGNCDSAESAVGEYIDAVNGLKAEDVETDVKESMRAAGFRLEELINNQCGDSAASTEPTVSEEPTTEEPTTEEPTTEEPTTEEEPTETETDTDTEEEPPEQPPGEGEVTPPPDEDQDGDNGGAGGGGDENGDSGTGGVEG